jgi:hypothetical protein
LALRELYKRQLWEKSILDKENDNETKEIPQDTVVKLYDPSLDETDSPKTFNTETDAKQVQNEESIVTVPNSELNTEPVPSSVTSEPPEISGVSSESEQRFLPDQSQPENPENKPLSVFNDKNRLSETFKIDEILDEMVNEDPPIIPMDLSLQIEQDGSVEDLRNQMTKENERDLLEQDDNEILTKIIAPTGSNDQLLSQSEMMFDNLNQEEDVNTVHSEISPIAVELLGEDFNFDSFFEEKLKSKQQNQEPMTAYEIGQGIYQADGGFLTNDSTLLNLLPKEQAIVSLYPDNLIQNAVAEPDLSEASQNYSFTEELLPMFIRKKKEK